MAEIHAASQLTINLIHLSFQNTSPQEVHCQHPVISLVFKPFRANNHNNYKKNSSLKYALTTASGRNNLSPWAEVHLKYLCGPFQS